MATEKGAELDEGGRAEPPPESLPMENPAESSADDFPKLSEAQERPQTPKPAGGPPAEPARSPP